MMTRQRSTKHDKRSLTPQEVSDHLTGSSPLIRLMQRYNIPATRESYLNLAYLGQVPDPLGAEEEAELPAEVRRST